MGNLLLIYIKKPTAFFKKKYYFKEEGNALHVCDIQNHGKTGN